MNMYNAIVNSPITQLSVAISDASTTIQVLDASLLPDAPNLATIGKGENAETILYTGKTGNDLTGVTRGFEGVAQAWDINTQVARFYTAYDHNTFKTGIENNEANLSTHKDDKLSHGYAGSNARLDADSFGVSGGNDGKRFYDRVVKTKKIALNNSSISGQTAWESWNKMMNEILIPSEYDVHLLNLGFNDARSMGNEVNYDNHIRHTIETICAYLRLENIFDHTDPSITYSGTWSESLIDQAYGGATKYTSEQGAFAEFQFNGDKLYIGSFNLAASNTGGNLEVSIDGIVKFSKVLDGEAVSTKNYVMMPLLFENLGDGVHTCRITNTLSDGTKNIYFDWYGLPSENPPIILVNGLTKMKTDQYSLHSPFNNGSDAVIENTNIAIREGLSMFDEKVIFINQSDYDPNNVNLVDTDGVHPNNFGHEWIASNILKRW